MINFEAIKYLHPNAEFTITDDDISTIIWHTPGISTPSNKQIEDANEEMQKEKQRSISDKEAAKNSAINKLKALGLTEEEAKALVGI
jgi:hypothetical protein